MDRKGGLRRSRRISPKIIFLILKGNNFFGHRLHFGKVVALKSKLQLLGTTLVHLIIFLAYTQKIRQTNIVWSLPWKDLECRKNRIFQLAQAWLTFKHFIFRETGTFLDAPASLRLREAFALIVLIMVPPYRGHGALENSFSVCGSHIVRCLHDSLLRHPDDALNSPPIPLLIKLLGSNYNAVPPLAAISALYFIDSTRTAHQRPQNQSSVQCLLVFAGAFTSLNL